MDAPTSPGEPPQKKKRNRSFRRYLRDNGVDVVSVWVFPGLNLSNILVSLVFEMPAISPCLHRQWYTYFNLD